MQLKLLLGGRGGGGCRECKSLPAIQWRVMKAIGCAAGDGCSCGLPTKFCTGEAQRKMPLVHRGKRNCEVLIDCCGCCMQVQTDTTVCKYSELILLRGRTGKQCQCPWDMLNFQHAENASAPVLGNSSCCLGVCTCMYMRVYLQMPQTTQLWNHHLGQELF